MPLRALSRPADAAPRWGLAVFAHNEAGRIGLALRSLAAAAAGEGLAVYVLANGCSDGTVAAVHACAAALPGLSVFETDFADKAAAWNVFVHELLPQAGVQPPEVCFFMDGDVWLEPLALRHLAQALATYPGANAAGALPASGRDREAWRQRMVLTGALAGNLYALRGRFVARVQAAGVRLPTGLIGEDLLVSWLAGSDLGGPGAATPSPLTVFHEQARFAFRSLSPWRPADYRLYARRLWRYGRRAVQHEMLMNLLQQRGIGAMPRDVATLYREAPLPSRLRWVGVLTPLRLLAVLQVRVLRRRAQQAATRG